MQLLNETERGNQMRNIIKDTLAQTAADHIQTITATNSLNGNDGRSDAYQAMFQGGIKYPGLNYSELKEKVKTDPELIAIASGTAPKKTGGWAAMVQTARGDRSLRGRG